MQQSPYCVKTCLYWIVLSGRTVHIWYFYVQTDWTDRSWGVRIRHQCFLWGPRTLLDKSLCWTATSVTQTRTISGTACACCIPLNVSTTEPTWSLLIYFFYTRRSKPLIKFKVCMFMLIKNSRYTRDVTGSDTCTLKKSDERTDGQDNNYIGTSQIFCQRVSISSDFDAFIQDQLRLNKKSL